MNEESSKGGRQHYIHGLTPVPAYESDGGPPPDPALGRNLDSIEKIRTWLQHPSNWIKSDAWVIKWDGIVPLINERHAFRLRVETHDTGLYEVVLKEQFRLRHPSGDEKEIVEE